VVVIAVAVLSIWNLVHVTKAQDRIVAAEETLGGRIDVIGQNVKSVEGQVAEILKTSMERMNVFNGKALAFKKRHVFIQTDNELVKDGKGSNILVKATSRFHWTYEYRNRSYSIDEIDRHYHIRVRCEYKNFHEFEPPQINMKRLWAQEPVIGQRFGVAKPQNGTISGAAEMVVKKYEDDIFEIIPIFTGQIWNFHLEMTLDEKKVLDIRV